MGKFAILLCAASTAFAMLVFVLPQTLNAKPSQAATVVVAPEVPGIADLFYAEKANAAQQELPPQF
jgi:hypothetical protein